MDRGWKATGLLTPLYAKVGGVDRLAVLSGISRQTLSAYNSGKRGMGMKNALRIAAAAEVSVADLGAPATPHGATLDDLAARMQAMEETQKRILELVGQLSNAVAVNSMSIDRISGRTPADSALRPRRRAL